MLHDCTGHPQAALAKDAIQIICMDKQPHHTVTLANPQPDGKIRHTLYEAWPARVGTALDVQLCDG